MWISRSAPARRTEGCVRFRNICTSFHTVTGIMCAMTDGGLRAVGQQYIHTDMISSRSSPPLRSHKKKAPRATPRSCRSGLQASESIPDDELGILQTNTRQSVRRSSECCILLLWKIAAVKLTTRPFSKMTYLLRLDPKFRPPGSH